jgi:hypothetical protein
MKTPLRSAAAALVLALPLVAIADAPSLEPRTGVRGGVPTTSGEFAGTWIYVNRDVHYALWIRTKDGKPQVKMQYQSLASPESFETDWAGQANYYMAGSPATFSLTLDRADADAIAGRWAWELTAGESARVENASITMERTGYGRTLAMNFKDYRRTTTSGSHGNVLKGPVTWTWIKVSKRELLWDELPW